MLCWGTIIIHYRYLLDWAQQVLGTWRVLPNKIWKNNTIEDKSEFCLHSIHTERCFSLIMFNYYEVTWEFLKCCGHVSVKFLDCVKQNYGLWYSNIFLTVCFKKNKKGGVVRSHCDVATLVSLLVILMVLVRILSYINPFQCESTLHKFGYPT